MPEPNLFLLFIRPLNAAGIRYLVSGSVAAMFYGEPRLTHDIDLIVFLSGEDVFRFTQLFSSMEYYCPPAEVIAVEAAREQRGHFNVIHVESGLKADFYLSGRDPLHAWAFRTSRQMQLENSIVKVAPPEYVIIRKLEYFREGGSEKHLRDIHSMLNLSSDQIDRKELEALISDRHLSPEWSKALAYQ